MESYKGFKVGDKVEITSFFNVRSEGVITSFGDRKVGCFAEPDTLEVWVNKVCCFDLLYLIRQDKIKKLPKYAVGDVVRRNNKQLIKCEITSVDQLCDKTYIYTLSDCGSAGFSESMLIPFDGFRIGDTVWTVKRGKGKIVADRESMPRRFKVVFEADKDHPTIICRHPKLTNLIPTESKYKEALNKTGYAFKIDVAVVEEYKPSPISSDVVDAFKYAINAMSIAESLKRYAKIAYKFQSSGVVYQCPPVPKYKFYKNGLQICPFTEKLVWMDKEPTYFGQVQVAPSAKFKVGDVVYFDRKKWDVEDVATNECKIRISASAGSCTHEFRAWTVVKESDLRLWKETKIKAILDDDTKNMIDTPCELSVFFDKFNVKHVGKNTIGDDVFVLTSKRFNTVRILFGIKGDDIY